MPFFTQRHGAIHRGERCPICDRSITWRKARTIKTCGAVKCRSVYREQQHELRRQQNERFERQHQQRLAKAMIVRDARAAADGIEDSHRYTTVILPTIGRRIVALPTKRRGRFAKKLIQLVETALATPLADQAENLSQEEEEAWALPVLGWACATCGGSCCRKGGTHAYLHVATILRYRIEHPGVRSRDIVADYCHHLASETYEDSCVFHAATGCTLPRNLRSDTCRGSLCSGLVELRNLIKHLGRTRFFFAAMCRNEVLRSEFAEFHRADRLSAESPNGSATPSFQTVDLAGRNAFPIV